eukprot:scaffold2774_cov87-Phaeocystis_antarctica.AAC.9
MSLSAAAPACRPPSPAAPPAAPPPAAATPRSRRADLARAVPVAGRRAARLCAHLCSRKCAGHPPRAPRARGTSRPRFPSPTRPRWWATCRAGDRTLLCWRRGRAALSPKRLGPRAQPVKVWGVTVTHTSG